MLLLPGDPMFDFILATSKPPGWSQHSGEQSNVNFVADSETGILRPVTPIELREYLEGGEYDERMSQFQDECEIMVEEND